jgi:rubrerythrin
MTPLQAFELALFNETRGRDFYAFVATDSPQPQVRTLAAEMAAEEDEHVELVTAWVERERLVATRMPEDLDPPNLQG